MRNNFYYFWHPCLAFYTTPPFQRKYLTIRHTCGVMYVLKCICILWGKSLCQSLHLIPITYKVTVLVSRVCFFPFKHLSQLYNIYRACVVQENPTCVFIFLHCGVSLFSGFISPVFFSFLLYLIFFFFSFFLLTFDGDLFPLKTKTLKRKYLPFGIEEDTYTPLYLYYTATKSQLYPTIYLEDFIFPIYLLQQHDRLTAFWCLLSLPWVRF